MLGLNRPKTEYSIKMYWFKFKGARNNILEYEPVGLPFKCKFTSNQDVAMISDTQGVVYMAMDVETTSSYPFKKNDKVQYLSKNYIITDVSIENNALSGGSFTNKPSAFITTLTLEGQR